MPYFTCILQCLDDDIDLMHTHFFCLGFGNFKASRYNFKFCIRCHITWDEIDKKNSTEKREILTYKGLPRH